MRRSSSLHRLDGAAADGMDGSYLATDLATNPDG